MMLLDLHRDVRCPNCGLEQRLPANTPEPILHVCPKLRGVYAPMLPVGMSAKVTAHDRDDYVGDEIVRLDANGRPIMSVTTERDDGTDALVFAPTATGTLGG